MTAISKEQFKKYIENFDFTTLFNHLGWSYLDEQTPIMLKDETYWFRSVAEKGGFRILVFEPTENQNLPDYATRLQLDRKIARLYREHLIIFCDYHKTTQIWQLFVKQLGKPSRLTETRWYKGQEPELLYQKTSNLFFTLDEEENITITDVVERVNANFSSNVEKVTKKFYENFRKEHKKFIEFIKGISVLADREWYASLMLNRLMFCYFIQKKGFLDNNLNYLKDKLHYCQQKKGKDKYYVSFYKNFLLALFHKGLGSPEQTEDLKKEFGKIPYLNGGLFDVHELEKTYNNINIADEAFENIFNFFDQYNWHLDTRITASGKDINPDVIGYIFEKYINDRAQMGAYYTKEDITEYISKNCIIPFLFDETQRKYPKAFKSSGTMSEVEVWQMLKDSGDTYIYDAVKKGINTEQLDFNTTIDIDDPEHPLWADLPDEIRAGFRPDLKDKIVVADDEPHLWQLRKEWNKPAPENIALPTEIYRELIDRRKRYWEIRKKIDNGEITHINDFITYNLNIRQFIQDVVDSHSDPEFIRYFYEALRNVTILDPTCGSGAFLFAAMNILEPLYESCIQRMENFVREAPNGKFKKFEEILSEVKAPEHPNLRYFIYKSIILRNLYGVDIMKEAVEIAKLRLFLKLVATVDADYSKPNLGLEPLPDIDFNIRAGNTLIGYATKKEIDDLQGMFVTEGMKKQILDECDVVSRAFQRFKELQLKGYPDKQEFTNAKTELLTRLKKLSSQLDTILHKQHYEGIDFNKWLETHKPFHWFAEFYEIINDKGGFDVVIGNPPYVEYETINYEIYGFATLSCGNLYAFTMERVIKILNSNSRYGMIVPSSATSTDGYIPLQKLLLQQGNLYVSSFSDQIGKLFDIPHPRLCIIIYDRDEQNQIFTTQYLKLGKDEYREALFTRFSYKNTTELTELGRLPRIEKNIEFSIFKKLKRNNKVTFFIKKIAKHKVYYTRKVSWYLQVLPFIPKIYDNYNNLRKPSELKEICFDAKNFSDKYFCVLNSTLFFWFFTIGSDCRNLNSREINNFNIDLDKLYDFSDLARKLANDMTKNSELRMMIFPKVGKLTIQCFFPKKSKPIIDEIDTVLAEHYGFTEEELDFIINYDIKYRMGKELESEEGT